MEKNVGPPNWASNLKYYKIYWLSTLFSKSGGAEKISIILIDSLTNDVDTSLRH